MYRQKHNDNNIDMITTNFYIGLMCIYIYISLQTITANEL